MILSLSSFAIAFTTISLFEPQGSYKFLQYYTWLHEATPISLLLHLVKPTNLAMIVGLLIPFLFLPLFRPRFLLLALFPFLQFALTEGGGGSVVLQTHYALLFLPALFLATISFLERGEKGILRGVAPGLLFILLTTATLYSTATLGPLLPTLSRTVTSPENTIHKEFLAAIPNNAPVAATYAFLTPLSSRRTVSSLHYAYLGKKQYATEDYALSETIEYLLIDFTDLLSYELQFPQVRSSAAYAKTGDDRLRALLNENGFRLIKKNDTLALFQKNAPQTLPPLAARTRQEEQVWSMQKDGDDLLITVPHSLHTFTVRDTLQLQLTLTETDGTQTTRTLPVGWGILPPHEWEDGETVIMRYRPPHAVQYAEAIIVRVTGGIEVDGTRSVVRRLDTEEIVAGPFIATF